MRLNEIYALNKSAPVISFEIFPPKGDNDIYIQKVDDLLCELRVLSKYNPALISVTYGAGGSTQEKTFDLVLKIKNDLNLNPMAHFTCVNFDKTKILQYVKKLEQNNIQNILALRGDAPIGQKKFIAHKNGFSHANELVDYIKSNTNLSVAVAGYPEKHPEAVNFDMDILNLKKKINAGADVIYTQLFFDNSDFYNYIEKVRSANIKVPIIPGIMIVQSFSQIERIVSLSGSKIPNKLSTLLDKYKDNQEIIKKIGIDFARQQVDELIKSDVKGLHFYPLNKSYAVSAVLDNILPTR